MNVISALPWKQIAYGAGAVLVSTIILEHVGRKREWKRRPSWAISKTADGTEEAFRWIGRQWARLSGLITYIDLGDFMITLKDLTKPTWRFFWAWFQFFDGYISVIKGYKWPLLYILGSCGLIGTAFLLHYYVSGRIRGGFDGLASRGFNSSVGVSP